MTTTKMAIVPFDLLDKSINGFEHEQGRARNELRELLAAPGNTGMGVGDGSGRLFVHGDYDSIKAMQAIILERDALRAAPKYPMNHGTHIIQFGDETFVWYDEAGLQGGVEYSLKSAEAVLLRYVEQLNRPDPRPADTLFKRYTIQADAEVTLSTSRPAGCCCPPPGHTGIWGAGMCPVHQGLRRVL
jgi:hypothetical protein